MSYIEIKITKAILYLTERELLNNLPKELIALGLERGRAFKRAKQMEKRTSERTTKPTKAITRTPPS